ncbi:TRM12 [Candida margitis]|uniref:TRM12 n=1 Tax=Candida margitis TaxID=1775924 RepID=UPI002227E568|nr:TRM12 [Candida margitis]KAI5969792.1 TRM12 [Candida margitis]
MIRLNISNAQDIKRIKTLLEENQWLNKSHKIEKNDGVFHIYTTLETIPQVLSHTQWDRYDLEEKSVQSLTAARDNYCSENNVAYFDVPKRWTAYPPMLLLSANTDDTLPSEFCKYLLRHYQAVFGNKGITHVALNRPIVESDILRRPTNLVPVYGDFGPDIGVNESPTEEDFNQAFWCSAVQNGILQTWAPRYTMFSRGNIKEKKRILDNYPRLKGTIVFDFYCGIGYFSLSYLQNGAKVLCWELNPWSIEGFRRSLEHGGYKYKIYHTNEPFVIDDVAKYDACIFLESNEVIPSRLEQARDNSMNISHINLGLLPTSKPSWSIANNLIAKKSMSNLPTLVHVHENVHVDDFDNMKNEIESKYDNSRVIHIEKVKTFAPDVWHAVFDVVIEHE